MGTIKVDRISFPGLTSRVELFVGLLALGFAWFMGFGFATQFAIWMVKNNVLTNDSVGWVLFPSFVGLTVLGIYLFVKAVRRARRMTEETIRGAFTRLAGRAPDRYHYHRRARDFAIGIAGDTLLIMDEGHVAAIPLGEIRDAWWDVPGWDTVTVYGTSHAAFVARWQADSVNKEARNEALLNSGFFVHVRHAEKPLWRFFSRDPAILRQWEEILLQAFERTGIRPAA